MNITCAICKDIFTPSDDVYSTQCGHIFHFGCIEHWFKQAKKTCPTCRKNATMESKSSHRIHRMFFDISHSPNIPQNVGTLLEQIDNMKYTLRILEADKKNVKERSEKMETQNKGLVALVRELEKKQEKNKELVFFYKEQLKSLKTYEEENAKLKGEISELKSSLEHLQNVKDLVQASSSKFTKIIEGATDPKKLQVYISVLKKYLDDTALKFKDIREKNKILKMEVIELTQQRNKLAAKCDQYSKMQENWAIHESSKLKATKKLQDASQKESAQEQAENCEINDWLANALKKPAKHKLNTLPEENGENQKPKRARVVTGTDESELEKEEKTENKQKNNTENSPYLQTKGGVSSLRNNLMKRNSNNSNDNLLLAKKRRVELNMKMNPNSAFRETSPDDFDNLEIKLRLKGDAFKKNSKNKFPKGTKLKADILNNKKLDSFIDLTKTP